MERQITTKNQRIDLRLNAANKRLLLLAAEKQGLNLTQFITSSSLTAARNVIKADETTVLKLSQSEAQDFFDSFDAEFIVNDYLRDAINQNRQLILNPSDERSATN